MTRLECTGAPGRDLERPQVLQGDTARLPSREQIVKAVSYVLSLSESGRYNFVTFRYFCVRPFLLRESNAPTTPD